MTVQVVCADVLDWASSYDGPPFHAVLTDPPYHLIQDSRNGSQRQPGSGPYGRHTVSTKGFMGKEWDGGGIAFQPETWAALASHLSPGAHVLAFGGSRTHHRLMVAIEDAGLEIRDCIYWAFGSGFPKSLDVSKAIDKAANMKRVDVGPYVAPDGKTRTNDTGITGGRFGAAQGETWQEKRITCPATPAAATWEGYGTALKPAVEVIVVARKPVEGTIAENCQKYGAGALNIDGGRIALAEDDQKGQFGPHKSDALGKETTEGIYGSGFQRQQANQNNGRWPANLVLSHLSGCKRVGTKRVESDGHHPARRNGKSMWAEGSGGLNGNSGPERYMGDPDGLETVDAWECAPGCPTQLFPQSEVSGSAKNGRPATGDNYHRNAVVFKNLGKWQGQLHNDSGSAARFFFQASWELDQAEQLDAADALRYCAKSSRAEREAGLDGIPAREYTEDNMVNRAEREGRGERQDKRARNPHPTVKPLTLCRYLATLLLPPVTYAPRRILVPFGGVASEAIGAMLAGWDEVVMIEKEREYCDISGARVEYWAGKMDKQMTMPLEVLA